MGSEERTRSSLLLVMSGMASAVGAWALCCRMDQDDSRDPKVGRVGEKSSPMDFESAVLGSFPVACGQYSSS